MGTIPVVMGDPEAECVAVLEAAFDDATVDVAYPSDPLAGDEVWLQVDLETGNADDYPIAERAQVRITAHVPNGRRTLAKATADQARTALASWDGNAAVAGVGVGPRSGVTTDPDTDNLMCWFLARVNLTSSPAPSPAP